MEQKGFLIIVLLFIFVLGLVVASEFGYNYLEDPNSFFGTVEFDGGWTDGGCSITDGEIHCQRGFFYNITSLNITKQNLTINDNLYVAGKVGIGTISPRAKLHVGSGNILLDNNRTIQFLTGDTDQARDVMKVDNENHVFFAPGIWSDLHFYSGGAERINVKAATGNIGLGTASPETPLDIVGAEDIGIIRVANVDTDATNKVGGLIGRHYTNAQEDVAGVWFSNIATGGRLVYGGGSGNFNAVTDHYFYTAADGTTTGGTIRMRIDPNGNVGIGTITPEAVLHVKKPAGFALLERTSGSTTSAVSPVKFKHTTTANMADGFGIFNAFVIEDSADVENAIGYIGFTRDGADNEGKFSVFAGTDGLEEFMTIRSLGNIGIGTATPQNTLNVVGDLNVTGIIINDAIYIQASDLVDQAFPIADVKQAVNLTTTDESNGISISESNVTVATAGVYYVASQPQVATGAGGAGEFHMWLEKHDTSSWVNVSNSNVDLVLANNEENVIPLIATIKLNANEKIRVMASVSDTAIKLDAQTGLSEPNIPSIIFTMYRIGS